MKSETCKRCLGSTNKITTMSVFNTDVICRSCKSEEKKHPKYKEAVDAEFEEIKKGNYNFPGIGYESFETGGLLKLVFTSKRRKEISISIELKNGRIHKINNLYNFRFPFKEGQHFNRNIEVWACNNGFFMDGKDTCPEKKIFGVKTKDVPKGHEWRSIFPNKFENGGMGT